MSRELHIVGFQVGRETYGVPITSLHEIVRVPEITAVPDAPDYLEGVINLRGKIVSVMDLRKRFGDKQATLKKQNRILVVEHSGKLAGLIVDSASEVVKIAEHRRGGSARRISGRRTELCHGIGQGSRPPDRFARHDQTAGSGQPAARERRARRARPPKRMRAEQRRGRPRSKFRPEQGLRSSGCIAGT